MTSEERSEFERVVANAAADLKAGTAGRLYDVQEVPNDLLVAAGKALAQAERLLESLTPGGSEFHSDPEGCAEWVRERLAAEKRANIRLAQENANLRARLAKAWGVSHEEAERRIARARELAGSKDEV